MLLKDARLKGRRNGALSLFAFAAAVAWAAAIWSPLHVAAQEVTPEPPITSLEARVVNGTADGGDVTGLPVTLQAFQGEEEVNRWEGRTVGPDGSVRYEELDATVGLVYLLSAAYDDVRYFSTPFFVSEPLEEEPVLTVYETTEDAGVIRIVGDSSVILEPDGDSGTLRAMQVTTFENTSDRTFVGADRANTRLTVEVPLPPQAFDVESISKPGSLVLSSDESGGVFSVLPVLPGTEEIVLTYRILYTTDAYTWTKSYRYAVQQVRLLVPEGTAVQLNEGWEKLPTSTVAGTVYDHYQTSGGPPGTLMTAQLRGLPIGAGVRSRNLEQTLRYVAMGLGVLAVGGVGGYVAFWTGRRRRQAAAAGTADDVGTPAAREEALARLAWLDEEFEAGRLVQDEYATLREEQRRILRRLMEEGDP